MSVEFVSVDRQALHFLEAAQKHAEACRQDWKRTLQEVPEPRVVVQAAINYAEAANAEAEAREKYEALVMEAIETERLRERLEELAV